jgi:hypothetical protein
MREFFLDRRTNIVIIILLFASTISLWLTVKNDRALTHPELLLIFAAFGLMFVRNYFFFSPQTVTLGNL